VDIGSLGGVIIYKRCCEYLRSILFPPEHYYLSKEEALGAEMPCVANISNALNTSVPKPTSSRVVAPVDDYRTRQHPFAKSKI
jgi:hypothetical protein